MLQMIAVYRSLFQKCSTWNIWVSKKILSGLSLIVICALTCSSATAAGIRLNIKYQPEQIHLPDDLAPKLQEIINNSSSVLIVANKYDPAEVGKFCLSRKYSLVRALKIRQFLIKKGMRLEKIKIIVSTNSVEENDIVTINGNKSS